MLHLDRCWSGQRIAVECRRKRTKTRGRWEGKRCSWEEDRHRFTYPFSRGVLRQGGGRFDEGFKVETKKQVLPVSSTTTRWCSVSSHGDFLARQLILWHVSSILAITDMHLPNEEQETSLFQLLTLCRPLKLKTILELIVFTLDQNFLICLLSGVLEKTQFSRLEVSQLACFLYKPVLQISVLAFIIYSQPKFTCEKI